jgi:DNA-directed RNA polymerase subunit N (RpoN/RPB10)
MIIPIKCFRCNKVIADSWYEYDERVNVNGEDPVVVLMSMGFTRRRVISNPHDLIVRSCCFEMFATNVDQQENLLLYRHPLEPKIKMKKRKNEHTTIFDSFEKLNLEQ